jgi:hypothetical protein
VEGLLNEMLKNVETLSLRLPDLGPPGWPDLGILLTASSPYLVRRRMALSVLHWVPATSDLKNPSVEAFAITAERKQLRWLFR